MKLLAVVGCFLSLSLTGLATETVLVVDRSPADCPVSYSGTVTLLEHVGLENTYEGYAGDLLVQNNSGKAVVAVVTTVLVRYSNGLNVTEEDIEENFWAPTPDLPGQEFTILLGAVRPDALTEKPVSGRTADSVGLSPQPPSVEVIPRWVQFADGSSWGDNKNPQVQETLNQRRKDIDTMRRLANMYDTQGAEAFAREVEQLPLGSFAYYLRALRKKQGNPQLVIEKLRTRLQVADARMGLL
ncbi:MAG: hypothetical protein WBM04_01940 [Candidatus Korobacteraceae bacterium]